MTTRHIGLNAATGQQISGLDHIRQSISKILLTPIGSRVMRRDFGSLIPDLVDQPNNGKNRMKIMAASAMAISTWEPRVSLTKVSLQLVPSGAGLYVDIELARKDGPSAGKNDSLRIQLKG